MSDNGTINSEDNVVGTLVYDERGNILQYSGIGKSRKQDITQLITLPVDKEGFASVSDQTAGLKVSLYTKDQMTVVTYKKIVN